MRWQPAAGTSWIRAWLLPSRVAVDTAGEIRIVQLVERYWQVHVGPIRSLHARTWLGRRSNRKDGLLCPPVLPQQAAHIAEAVAREVEPERPLAHHEVEPQRWRTWISQGRHRGLDVPRAQYVERVEPVGR